MSLTAKAVLVGSVATSRAFCDPATGMQGSWTYDNEGQVTGVTYPSGSAGPAGASYTMGYNSLAQPVSTTDGNPAALVGSASYGVAGELLSVTGLYTESRSYNSRLQLTAMNGVTFAYAAGNNGRIASESASGITISYGYDSLNRPISASSCAVSGRTHPLQFRPAGTPTDGTEKFATYWRDGTGLDYAVNRYYSSGAGRFLTPDPYMASGGPGDPGSWNRYGYVQGDPIGLRDPAGLQARAPICYWSSIIGFGAEGWFFTGLQGQLCYDVRILPKSITHSPLKPIT